MRKEFTMTKEQLDKLLDACKPVPYMVIGGVVPRSPQENANAAWASLGLELGFDAMTVRPVIGKGTEVFTAEFVQNESQSLAEWMDRYEAELEAGQTRITRDEAERRFYKQNDRREY